MSLFEFPPGRRSAKPEGLIEELEDFKSSPELYRMLLRLPPELQRRHIPLIEELPDEEAMDYVSSLLERREAANREFYVSDKLMGSAFAGHESEIQTALETRVFNDAENFLGGGQTARIQRFRYRGDDVVEHPMAIKYLVTPTATTLTVDAEHDLLEEVERMERIERVEAEKGVSEPRLKVPHPYFYYKKGRTQCYGMEEVNGIDLARFREGKYPPNMRAELREAFKDMDIESIKREADAFLDAMHTICLHGDIKPANVMVSTDGKFYLIDFGQSRLPSDIDEKSQEAFENLKDEEKRGTKFLLAEFLKEIKSEPQ